MIQIKKQKTLVRSLVAAGVIVAGAGGYGYVRHEPTLFTQASAASISTTAGQSIPLTVMPNFADIVARNGSAVVNVSVSGMTKTGENAPGANMDPNDPFFQFFRQFQDPVPQAPMPVRGMGSGFIVSADGVILTNAHVVDGAKVVTVKLTDKREFTAKVVGVDKASDIAVLKIGATNLPTVTLDRADDVRVGEWVVAIGAPFGFENSATAGIVSAKSRTLGNDSYVPFLQTDVAVNPGNSGGPLFNSKGEVVGINSQIYSRSGGYQGISFAIPIDVALHVKDQLLEHGSVTRGHLGVTIQDVNQDLADAFGLKKPAGALVSSVEKGSVAEKAGLEPGDVIMRYNDKEIVNSTQIPVLVADAAPGTTATLDVMRKGESRRINVTIGKVNDVKVASAEVSGQSNGRLGVVVRPLNDNERVQADVSGGVVVENSGGPAAEAGIQPGDVILSLNGTPVKTPESLRQLVTKSPKHIALLIKRDEAKIFVPVDLG